MTNPIRRISIIFALVTLLSFLHVSPARSDTQSDSAYIPGVSGHAQRYSLSCESRSAVDLAAFWGISIEETEFLQSLPRADNPDEGFVGDPNDIWGNLPPNGYGVHAGPVAATLQEYGLVAEAHRDINWDDLREEIDAGRPVIVWVIGQMWGGEAVEYEAPDGSTSSVAAFEHTMILTGYSPDAVQVVDAYTGNNQSYWLRTFLKSWAVLGNMAVFGSHEVSNSDTAVRSETHDESYTVQYGDYLVALADKFGTTWQELAQLNSVGYPFTIYPGQVLKLPSAGTQEVEVQPETEPAVVESPPNGNPAIFKIHLPVIQLNSTAQSASSSENTPIVAKPVETVIVQSSNTLLAFSKGIGVDWHLLVELNDLHPPYLVHPGQVLKLR